MKQLAPGVAWMLIWWDSHMELYSFLRHCFFMVAELVVDSRKTVLFCLFYGIQSGQAGK